MSSPVSRRTTVALLLGLMLLLFARAGWWVATNQVPTQIDEAAHLAYVDSLAHGHYPVTGQSTVSAESIELLKDNPVGVFRSLAFPPVPTAEWGISEAQYEAFQPPLYYLSSVPAYDIGQQFGIFGAVYALRIWTVFLVALGIPLLYFAGRELFPQRPAVWFLAPTALTAVQMVVSNLAQITNDAIMIPLGAAALWAMGRYFNRASYGRAAIVGAVIGLAFLGKTTAISLVAAALVALVGLLVTRAGERRQLITGGFIAAGVAAVLVAPWLLWNLHDYHALTGIKANAKLVLPITGRLPRTHAEISALVDQTRETLWATQFGGNHNLGYSHLWEWAVVGSVGIGTVAGLLRRRVAEAATILWLTAIAPLGFAILVWSLYSQADGVGGILGRHLAVAVPALCLAVAAGVVLAIEARLAIIVLLLFLTASAIVEVSIDRSYLTAVYATPVLDGTAPVVNQSWSDATVNTATMRIVPTCSVVFVGLSTPNLRGALGPPVPTVAFRGKDLGVAGADGTFALFRLPTPQLHPFDLTLKGSVPIEMSSTHRNPRLTIISPGIQASPTARLYCPSADPAAARFDVLEHPGHPAMSYSFTRSWPIVAPVTYGTAGLVAILWTLRDVFIRRPGQHHRRRASRR